MPDLLQPRNGTAYRVTSVASAAAARSRSASSCRPSASTSCAAGQRHRDDAGLRGLPGGRRPPPQLVGPVLVADQVRQDARDERRLGRRIERAEILSQLPQPVPVRGQPGRHRPRDEGRDAQVPG